MPFRMGWYIEPQVIFAQFWGEMTVEDLQHYFEMTNQYAEHSSSPLVHTIADVSQITKPLNMVELASVMKGFRTHEHVGWTITLGEKDPMLRFVSSIARQLLRLRQRTFDSFHEAVDFLKEMDTNIDWNRANPSALINSEDRGESNHDD